MLLIKKLNDDTEYETVGEYRDGEFTNFDAGFDPASLRGLEGVGEEQIQRSLDGPRTIAVRPEQDSS